MTTPPPYVPDEDRYDGRMPYRRTGRSGLLLPAISLGCWHNFGDEQPIGTQRAILRRAFDRGVTHFDLANNYGPPYGSAETNVGRILREDFAPYRDELIISSKAGYDMWPGPYGDLGSRKYLLASLDQSLVAARTGLRRHLLLPPGRPGHAAGGDGRRAGHGGAAGQGAVRGDLVVLAGADPRGRVAARRGGRAAADPPAVVLDAQPLDRGRAPRRARASSASAASGSRRWRRGCCRTSTSTGVPEGSRASRDSSLSPDLLTDEALAHIRALNAMATERGQSLAQMALAWTLRDPRVTSTLVGARTVEQLDDSLDAVGRWSSPTRSWPRSTSTPSTPASTSGRTRGTPDAQPTAGLRWAGFEARSARCARTSPREVRGAQRRASKPTSHGPAVGGRSLVEVRGAQRRASKPTSPRAEARFARTSTSEYGSVCWHLNSTSGRAARAQVAAHHEAGR